MLYSKLIAHLPFFYLLCLYHLLIYIQSSDTEEYDYTILELFRFSELLAAGDPKCVETLFLHPSSIYSISAEFKHLVDRAHLFLNR